MNDISIKHFGDMVTATPTCSPVKKLNLGAGDIAVDGFEPRDARKGDVLWPLPDADASVDEIRASHVLEHFAHAVIADVLREWVRALKPGGVLQIAVPDFQVIAEQYLAGANLPIEGYVMGGQVDRHDYHKAIFDVDTLSDLLRAAGLVGIRRWKSEVQDCASLPVSLNLAATKPPAKWPKIAAVVSMPRLGFNDFWACAYRELAAMGIPLKKTTGAYWDRDLTIGIEQELRDEDPEWILTLDYDTIFTRHQLQCLMDLAVRYPHADAIAPLQTARHHAQPMFTARLPTGELVTELDRKSLRNGEVIKAETAHFGLTLLRAAKLKALPKPWFERAYDEQGGYGDAGCDPDINFWRRWKKAGNTLYVALRVPVGHGELMVRWPDQNLEASFQRPSEFFESGPPANVWR